MLCLRRILRHVAKISIFFQTTFIVSCIFCKDSENSLKTSISYPFFHLFCLVFICFTFISLAKVRNKQEKWKKCGDHFFHFIKKESVWTPLCYYNLFIFLEHCNFRIEKSNYLIELRVGSLNDKCNITFNAFVFQYCSTNDIFLLSFIYAIS